MKTNPLKKSKVVSLRAPAKQSHGIATPPLADRNDFFRGFKTEVRLKIADIVVLMTSKFPIEQWKDDVEKQQATERFKNFLYTGNKSPHITINVEVVERLPYFRNSENIFITNHPDDGRENWRLLKKDGSLIYKSVIKDKKQTMVINELFNRANAFLKPVEGRRFTWHYANVIYDFLQVMLINYFALNNSGIFAHSMGIKDTDGSGLLFCGRSGSGKSTSARIWDKYSDAMVLNDDRVIVGKDGKGYRIHGSPWHGEFSDYLAARMESAPLKKIFFIYHAPKNEVKQISPGKAFGLLYPSTFPPFWDKHKLMEAAGFCQELVEKVPCYNLGFVNDKDVIDFVRGISRVCHSRESGNL